MVSWVWKKNRMETAFSKCQNDFSIFYQISQLKTSWVLGFFWLCCCVVFTSLACIINSTKYYSSYCFLIESNPTGDSKRDLTVYSMQPLHDIWPYCDMWHFEVCCSRWFIMQQYLRLSTETLAFLQKHNCASDNAIYSFWYRQSFSFMPQSFIYLLFIITEYEYFRKLTYKTLLFHSMYWQ